MIRVLLAVTALAVLLASAPARAAPCAGFTDVLDTSQFCQNITWVKNRGITLGCTSTTLYCPTAPVTREQMAAFMYRLGFQNAFLNGGNAFGAPAVLGTSDAQTMDLHVHGRRALRLEDGWNSVSAPSITGGHPQNFIGRNCRGAVNALACQSNLVEVSAAVIGGGGSPTEPNTVTDFYGVVAGGVGNRAGDDDVDATNTRAATVSGGAYNLASGFASTVGGGEGNVVSGSHATVPGGNFNSAAGDWSMAAGVRAKAVHDRSFVWGGSSSIDTTTLADGDFVVYAPGAIRLFAGVPGSGGCTLNSGAGWSCSSDRALKTAFAAIDAQAILVRVAALPVSEWSLAAQPAVRHVGPTAQDFRAAFGLGGDDTTITSVDAQGIALAAIQGLNAKLEERTSAKDAQIAALRERLAKVEADHARDIADVQALHRKELADLRLAVEVLMARTPAEGRIVGSRAAPAPSRLH